MLRIPPRNHLGHSQKFSSMGLLLLMIDSSFPSSSPTMCFIKRRFLEKLRKPPSQDVPNLGFLGFACAPSQGHANIR